MFAQNKKKQPDLIDSTVTPVVQGGEMGLKLQQHIPDEFIAGLKDQKNYNDSHKFGDKPVKLASIPVAIVDQWLREGFDIYRESAQSIMDRLRAEEMTDFLTSSKRIGNQKL